MTQCTIPDNFKHFYLPIYLNFIRILPYLKYWDWQLSDQGEATYDRIKAIFAIVSFKYKI